MEKTSAILWAWIQEMIKKESENDAERIHAERVHG